MAERALNEVSHSLSPCFSWIRFLLFSFFLSFALLFIYFFKLECGSQINRLCPQESVGNGTPSFLKYDVFVFFVPF